MSKRLKKLVTSISLALAIISMSSITAFAQSNTIEGFKKEYMTHAENRETAFTLNYTGDSTELTNQLDKILVDETKNDEYLEASWMTKGASTTGVNGNFNVAVKMTYVETKAQLDYVDKKVEAIVSSVIKPGMTEMEKAYALQDYVCNITVYDSTLVKKSAYNALTDGKTVCRGYAMLMYKLYEKAGIPVHIVQGTAYGGGHAWNMFEVDGNWYYLDATNNDASGNRLKYFGLSENSLKSYGFAWTQGNLPTSSSNLTSDNGDLIAISNAATAVTNVENLKTQVSIDSANSLVGVLTDGAYKTALQERITAVQTALNVANDQVATAGLAVDKAETSLITADELSAEKLVNTLPESAIKTNYIARLKYVKQEISAMTTVTNAETKKIQSYVDSAVKLVTALTDSNLKTSLQSRLKTVQETIASAQITTATNAVTIAETSILQSDLTNAQKLVTALTDSDIKTNLQTRLTALQTTIIQKATDAVTTCESTLATTDVANSNKLVSALIAGTDKTALTARMKLVSQEMKVITAVVNAETKKTQSSVDSAVKLVTALPDGDLKATLQSRLTTAQDSVTEILISNATTAVIKAQTSQLEADEIVAQKLVTALASSDSKTALQSRLDSLQAVIIQKATDSVSNCENTLLQADVATASKLVNALVKGTNKTTLQARMKIVSQQISAITSVEKAELNNTQTSVTNALKLVNALVDGDLKTSLLDRLNTVQGNVTDIQNTNATTAVEKAETTLLEADEVKAQKLVTALVTDDIKTALQSRLDDVQTKIIKIATDAVAASEETVLQTDLANASKLVNALVNGVDKTALIARIRIVNQEISALNAVVNAEKNKTLIYITNAQKFVTNLPNGEFKDSLQARLDAL